MKKKAIFKYLLPGFIIIVCGILACYFTGSRISSKNYCEERSGGYYYKYNRIYDNSKRLYLYYWTIGKSKDNNKENILYTLDIDKIYTPSQNLEREKMLLNNIRLKEYKDRIEQMNSYKIILITLIGLWVIYFLKYIDNKHKNESYYDGYVHGTTKAVLITCFISIGVLLYIIENNKIHLDGIYDLIYLIK